MEKRAYITGLGGQGVMLIAKLFIKSCYHEGMDVLMYPTYGGEQRGGASNAAVMISDKKVGAPSVAKYDVVLYLHQNAYDIAPNAVREGGISVINSALVSSVKDAPVKKVFIDANAEAEKLGSVRSANMIMLGVLTCAMNICTLESVISTMRAEMASKPQFIELNETAITIGYRLAQAQLEE